MSEKCKGQRLCMSRDEYEALHVCLAAKDAQIAELRQQRNEASVLQLRAMAERDEAFANVESLQRVHLEDIRRICELSQERDEARECVVILYRCLSELVKDAPKTEPERPDGYNVDDHAGWAIDFDLYHMAKSAHEALAATPEHLRK